MAASTHVPLPQPVPTEEKMAAFDSVPLFMKSLPEDALDDPTVAALQSLAHEGSPDGMRIPSEATIPIDSQHVEIAQNFKEQGNDYFKGRRYREAVGFYTQGIDAKPTEPALTEALLCNRAACNLELSERVPVDVLVNLAHRPASRKLWISSEGLFEGHYD